MKGMKELTMKAMKGHEDSQVSPQQVAPRPSKASMVKKLHALHLSKTAP
jgi:hypothetical protein